MAMKSRTISYMVKQGFKGLWRNRMMSIVSMGSIASTLAILGMIFVVIININNLTETAEGQFDSLQVYLKEGLTQEQITTIGDTIKKTDGVKQVYFLSKEQALINMKEGWGKQGYLLEGLEKNPLPHSYVIKLSDIKYADQVVNNMKKIQELEDVRYYKEIVDKLIKFTNFIRLAGMALIGILIVISMFVVSNTIKLTVMARSKEINIMKYVGATNWFIRWPLFVEGMVLGLLGALIALAVVGFGYRRILDLITKELYVLFSTYMIPASAITINLFVIFIVLGMGIGALGSIFSMRRFLKV